jgi:hypothetical protein
MVHLIHKFNQYNNNNNNNNNNNRINELFYIKSSDQHNYSFMHKKWMNIWCTKYFGVTCKIGLDI